MRTIAHAMCIWYNNQDVKNLKVYHKGETFYEQEDN